MPRLDAVDQATETRVDGVAMIENYDSERRDTTVICIESPDPRVPRARTSPASDCPAR